MNLFHDWRRLTPSLRKQKIDYPKFDRDVRHYITFKKNFDQVVKASGKYLEAEMSIIMRTHCLPRNLWDIYRNLSD